MNELRAVGLSGLLTGLFPVTFLALALWEALRPARLAVNPLSLRWFGNSALFGLALAISWTLPLLSGYGAAVLAARHGWGLFHLVSLPSSVTVPLSIVALDFFSYWMHRLFHGLPLFWRLHALHHSDTDLDVTTTIRHHPAEALAEAPFDVLFAILLGLPPEAIAFYGGIVLVIQTFNHGNVVLPTGLRWLNSWLMTPDLHRLHHSMRYNENNSNFGNTITQWDRLFGTLMVQPEEDDFRVGLPEFAGARFQRLDRLLAQPLFVAGAPPTTPRP